MPVIRDPGNPEFGMITRTPRRGRANASMAGLHLVFMHGWGYDATFWEPLIGILKPKAVTLLDTGYFSAVPALDLPSCPFIGVGHSAGGLWLMSHQHPSCRGVMMINSFTRFTRADGFPEGLAPAIMARMQRGLEHDAGKVVATFRARLGDVTPFGQPHQARLKAGLSALTTGGARDLASGAAYPVSCIAALDDPLISRAHTAACFKQARTLTWGHGGHLLPRTNPDLCAHEIAKFESA